MGEAASGGRENPAWTLPRVCRSPSAPWRSGPPDTTETCAGLAGPPAPRDEGRAAAVIPAACGNHGPRHKQEGGWLFTTARRHRRWLPGALLVGRHTRPPEDCSSP